MDIKILNENSIKYYLEKYNFLINFFENNQLTISEKHEDMPFIKFFNLITLEKLDDIGISREDLIKSFIEYFENMKNFLGIKEEKAVENLTIIAGTNKLGEKEKFEDLTLRSGEIISIVGPTGSGKSRLLGDIEWIAQQDTPTNRKILINGEIPDMKWRFSSSNKLVAQLSQNMNFVMDLTVHEFLKLHAKSRLVEKEDEIIEKILNKANELAGEKFDIETEVTSLSGGQSRALMIADTAILSKSPIVLIDEIENAGIDRKKALDLLVDEGKIVIMATHDPLLALMCSKRIVIQNGGIHDIIVTTKKEKQLLLDLEKMDDTIQSLRHSLRSGKIIEKI